MDAETTNHPTILELSRLTKKGKKIHNQNPKGFFEKLDKEYQLDKIGTQIVSILVICN